MDIMYILGLALLGGLLSRGHGAGWLPKFWMSLLWAVVPTVFVAMAYLDAQMLVWAVIAAAVCLAGCSLGIATGNAPFRDLGTFNGVRRKVKLLFIVEPLYGKLPERAVDALGLAVIGLASVSGFVLPMALLNPLAAGIVAFGGLLKPVGYIIGWRLFTQNKNGEATSIGETVSGAFAYASLALATM